MPFKSPGELADQAGKNVWDIGLIGAEPQRAAVMTFSAAYVEIEATYMVPPGSPIKSIAEVDKKGVQVVTSARSAYGLWLENNIKNAELIQIAGLDGAFNKFSRRQDRRAGRPAAGPAEGHREDAGRHHPAGKFSAVQQAVGCNKPAAEGARYIADFVEKAKKSGLVASLIEKHKVKGLSVAPPGLTPRSGLSRINCIFPRNQISQAGVNLRCGGRVRDGGARFPMVPA